MVRAVDIEGLLQKYMEEDNLEKADALYLLYTIGSEGAAKTLRVRYGRSGSLSSVLDDLRELGLEKPGSYEITKDTGEDVSSVIKDSFKQICLNTIIEFAKDRATSLSNNAREILYLISSIYPESIYNSELQKFYKLLFQKTLPEHELKKALDGLIYCYFVQYVRSNGLLEIPPYFDDLLFILDIIPKVEVKVAWPTESI